MQEWIIGLKKVLAEEKIEFLSDDDLFHLVNHRLNKKNRIAKRTFDYWKAGKYAPDDVIGEEFMDLIKLSRIKQKQALGQKMFEENNMSWTKYAWILERKFEELNLKRISENVNKNETTTIIQISAGNDEQKQLIDNIINVDFEDITDVKPQPFSAMVDNKKDDEEMPF
ncbi:hypothetical protein ABGT15_04525 [Flavobacterium enshiense]|uniref:hypothetical protein n=1 Tax=Flavobacterium enshiense TaxID=1341165 RepID=UPI00345D2C44